MPEFNNVMHCGWSNDWYTHNYIKYMSVRKCRGHSWDHLWMSKSSRQQSGPGQYIVGVTLGGQQLWTSLDIPGLSKHHRITLNVQAVQVRVGVIGGNTEAYPPDHHKIRVGFIGGNTEAYPPDHHKIRVGVIGGNTEAYPPDHHKIRVGVIGGNTEAYPPDHHKIRVGVIGGNTEAYPSDLHKIRVGVIGENIETYPPDHHKLKCLQVRGGSGIGEMWVD